MRHGFAGTGLNRTGVLKVLQKKGLSALESGFQFSILCTWDQHCVNGIGDVLVVGNFVIDVKLVKLFTTELLELLCNVSCPRLQAAAGCGPLRWR